MGVILSETLMRRALERIATTDGELRTRATNALIVKLHEREVLKVWGQNLAAHYGRRSDAEDITGVVNEAVLVAVTTLTTERLSIAENAVSYLYFQAKAAVALWLDSPAVTIASAMTGVSRRHRLAQAARAELTSLTGAEPTVDEIIEHVNNRLLETRKDARKQGVLISREDVDGRWLRPHFAMSAATGFELAGGWHAPEDDYTTPAEAAITVAQLQRTAEQMFPGRDGVAIADAIAEWSQMVLDGERPTAVLMSARLGVSRRTASERIRQVDEVLAAFREAAASDGLRCHSPEK